MVAILWWSFKREIMSNPLYLELEDLEVESGQRLLGLDLGSKTMPCQILCSM